MHWIQLSLTEGLGPVLTQRLVEVFGGAEAACAASEVRLRSVEGIGMAKAASIARSLAQAAGAAEAELRRAQSLGMRMICPDDGDYPTLLRTIHDPPSVLYMTGTLEPRDLNAVAIVGSRRCSHYGREQADRFGALLAGAGFTVVSGGARGIDSASHRGALKHPDGRTIAVLGSGLDVPYPPENAEMFKVIAQHGAVLSEYPLGTPPNPENFPRRNRIVAGMSRGVLVVEADKRSGALITARLAGEEQGRPIFAIPGRLDSPMSVGAHQLIRDGATLTTGLEDILEGLGPLPQLAAEPMLFSPPADVPLPEKQPDKPPTTPTGLTPAQQKILANFDGAELSVDQIIDRTGLAAADVLKDLTLLSLKGLIKRVEGQTYAARTR